MEPSQEFIYFKSPRILITSSRVVTGGVAYPLSTIAAVEMQKHDQNRGYAIVLPLIGVAAIFVFIVLTATFGISLIGLIVLIIIVVGSVGLTSIARPTFWVVLDNARERKRIYRGTSLSDAESLVRLIRQAIAENSPGSAAPGQPRAAP